MVIELFHNKIVKDTMSDKFSDCINTQLIPLLEKRYGDALSRVLMYEDYIADKLELNGECYYPFTLTLNGENKREWVKWGIANRKQYKNESPYSYIGKEPLNMLLVDNCPSEICEKIAGRAMDYSHQSISVKIHAAAEDPLILVGRYSQSFVDALAIQITNRLVQILGVGGIADSGIQLQIVFAPGTYMEHTSENVTYRRLLITDGLGQPRDFWVKWTRLGSVVGYTVSEHISGEDIVFDLGEDVPQKIREKEFRFLCTTNPDKYQSAMGKKTVTEWREIIKRAIRKGTLVNLPCEFDSDATIDTVNEKISAIIKDADIKGEAPAEENTDGEDNFASVMDMARAALAKLEQKEESVPDEEACNSEELPVLLQQTEENANTEAETQENTEEAEAIDIFDLADAADGEITVSEADMMSDDTAEEQQLQPVEFEEAEGIPEETAKEEVEKTEEAAPDFTVHNSESEDIRDIRARLEAQIRLEYEALAREKYEKREDELRCQAEALVAENERLNRIARQAEQDRLAQEREFSRELEKAKIEHQKLLRQTEELRLEIDSKNKQEERERDRLTEAARIAVEEQRRLEQQRAEREEKEREQSELLAAKQEAEREAERIEADRRSIALTRAAELSREDSTRTRVSYVTKRVKIIFRRSVDPNIIKSIKNIIENTLIKEQKQQINIRMKAYVQDASTISLDILKIPENETALLVEIIKAIGNGGIGVSKITLE